MFERRGDYKGGSDLALISHRPSPSPTSTSLLSLDSKTNSKSLLASFRGPGPVSASQNIRSGSRRSLAVTNIACRRRSQFAHAYRVISSSSFSSSFSYSSSFFNSSSLLIFFFLSFFFSSSARLFFCFPFFLFHLRS